jgi:hypothetical protein
MLPRDRGRISGLLLEHDYVPARDGALRGSRPGRKRGGAGRTRGIRRRTVIVVLGAGHGCDDRQREQYRHCQNRDSHLHRVLHCLCTSGQETFSSSHPFMIRGAPYAPVRRKLESSHLAAAGSDGGRFGSRPHPARTRTGFSESATASNSQTAAETWATWAHAPSRESTARPLTAMCGHPRHRLHMMLGPGPTITMDGALEVSGAFSGEEGALCGTTPRYSTP